MSIDKVLHAAGVIVYLIAYFVLGFNMIAFLATDYQPSDFYIGVALILATLSALREFLAEAFAA
jgi:hypothetical protein